MLRKLKQIISVFLIGILAVSVFPLQALAAWSAPTTTDWEPLSRTGIKARFAVGSDIHIGSDYGASEKLENALDVIYTIDPDTDAVMFAGDITNNGTASQYNTMMDIADNSELSGKIIWSMGNHEFYGWSDKQDAINEFKTKTGQEPDKVVIRGGITIITLGTHSEDGGDYSKQYDFLKNALESAALDDPTAPIFVIAHHAVYDSAYTTDEWYGNYGVGTANDMVALMAKYPQVIHISGHSHATVEDARSIDQSKGFTCIQDGTLGAYFENESGKINSNGTHSTYPEDNTDASQALMIDVNDDNTVTIQRMNLTTGKYIYENEPWVIDIPELVSSENFTYTDSREGKGNAPAFADGAQVTVTSSDADSVAFSFNQAAAADGLNVDMVHSYKMKVTNVETGVAIEDKSFNRNYFLRFADYYLPTQASTLAATISGLSPNTEYKIEVWALTSFNVESSNSISTTFATTAESNTPTITSKLTTEKPVIDGDLTDSIWSVDNKLENDMNDNAEHSAAFDVKWDYSNVYLALQVKGDADLAAGTAWDKGDIAWLYFDPTLHASTPYTDGDWQIGIGYNPDDNTKPYIIMGGGVTADSDVKTTLSNSISATTAATADGWNAEIAIPWDKLGIDVETKHELGFDLSVDNYQEGKDLEAIDWCGCNWNDTSGFGKLVLSNNSILDVDFSDGTAKDNSPAAHTAVKWGDPVISDNSSLGKKMASFDGDDDAYAYNLAASDYENIKNGFTMDCMMKLNEYNNSDPFMNCDGAGLGFELNSDGHTLEFWAHIDGSYTVPSVDISEMKSKWVNATATYDGTAMKLYINGELKATEEVSGSLDIPKDSAKWLMIGADTGSDGSVQLPSACDISKARLYGGAMSADEVAALYAEDNPVTFTLADNSALTGTAGQAVTIPSATAKDANGTCAVSTTVMGLSGEKITISSNAFTPAAAGTYTITYTANGQNLTKTVTVTVSSGSSGSSSSHHSSGTSGSSGSTAQTGSETTQAVATPEASQPSPDNLESGQLKDISSHWAKDAIKYTVDKGILKGTGEGTFDPDGSMTRAMIATVLWRMEGSTATAGTQNFSDVSAEAWYNDAVSWAATNGIASGNGSAFAPNGNVTREQLAVMLYNYAKHEGLDTTASGSISGYSDRSSVSTWAADAMNWAVGAGMITGESGGTLNPQGASTRAEVATILMRFIKR